MRVITYGGCQTPGSLFLTLDYRSMLVLLLLRKVHRPGQLGKKGGAKAEFPETKLPADVFQQEILYFHILQFMYKTELIVLISLFKEEMAFGGV